MIREADPIEELALENPERLALFSLVPELKISFKPLPTGRVCGVIRGNADVIKKVLDDLAANKPVPSRDLLEAIRRTRTSIFSAKSAIVKSGGLRIS